MKNLLLTLAVTCWFSVGGTLAQGINVPKAVKPLTVIMTAQDSLSLSEVLKAAPLLLFKKREKPPRIPIYDPSKTIDAKIIYWNPPKTYSHSMPNYLEKEDGSVVVE